MDTFRYRLGMVKLRYKLEWSPGIRCGWIKSAPSKRQQCIMRVYAELWLDHRQRGLRGNIWLSYITLFALGVVQHADHRLHIVWALVPASLTSASPSHVEMPPQTALCSREGSWDQGPRGPRDPDVVCTQRAEHRLHSGCRVKFCILSVACFWVYAYLLFSVEAY